MLRKNYLALLKLEPHFQEKELRNHFRTLIKQCHPDLAQDPADRVKNNERAKELINAYKWLQQNPQLTDTPLSKSSKIQEECDAFDCEINDGEGTKSAPSLWNMYGQIQTIELIRRPMFVTVIVLLIDYFYLCFEHSGYFNHNGIIIVTCAAMLWKVFAPTKNDLAFGPLWYLWLYPNFTRKLSINSILLALNVLWIIGLLFLGKTEIQ